MNIIEIAKSNESLKNKINCVINKFNNLVHYHIFYLFCFYSFVTSLLKIIFFPQTSRCVTVATSEYNNSFWRSKWSQVAISQYIWKDFFVQTTSHFLPIYPFHLYCEEPSDLIINRLNAIVFFDQNLPTSF